jgi:hypothetical protein
MLATCFVLNLSLNIRLLQILLPALCFPRRIIYRRLSSVNNFLRLDHPSPFATHSHRPTAFSPTGLFFPDIDRKARIISHLQPWTCLAHGTILRETSTGVTLLSICQRTLSMQGKRKSHFAVESPPCAKWSLCLPPRIFCIFDPSLALPDVSPLDANLS